MKSKALTVFFIILICTVRPLLAQESSNSQLFDPEKIYKISLHEGAIFVGHIIGTDGSLVIFMTASNIRMEIPMKKIKSIEEASFLDEKPMLNANNGTISEENSGIPRYNSTHYLFGSSAINMKKGEGYYQNTYLILNSFNHAFTDNFTLGGGFELLSTFMSLAEGNFSPIIYIAPKIGVQLSDNLHIGLDAIYANMMGISGNMGGGIGSVYGLLTYGSLENNITVGVGKMYVDGNVLDAPAITVSAMISIVEDIAFITENNNGNNMSPIFSYGLRFIGKKTSFDLAFINNSAIAKEILIGFPFLSLSVGF